MSFDTSVKRVLKNEWGYSNDPQDEGKETKWGISRRAYPKLDIKHIHIKQAIQIYYTDYWLRFNCSLLPNPIDEDFFDAVVNTGGEGAIVTLQKALNTLLQRKILEYGEMGPETESAIRKVDIFRLKDKFILERIRYYLRITDRDETQRKFLRGWLHRVLE